MRCFLAAKSGAEAENPLDEVGPCPIAEGSYRWRFAGWRDVLVGRAGLVSTDVCLCALGADSWMSNTRCLIALDKAGERLVTADLRLRDSGARGCSRARINYLYDPRVGAQPLVHVRENRGQLGGPNARGGYLGSERPP